MDTVTDYIGKTVPKLVSDSNDTKTLQKTMLIVISMATFNAKTTAAIQVF